jgi:DNA-binding XRE family transcriptional regulator
MKNEEQQQAKSLYFDTNLTKSEIAERLGVNRRTIMLWSHQGNWEQLKQSARHLPSMVAEKCYYLIDHLATERLTMGVGKGSVSYKDAETINKLASSIKKLKNRSTSNETMEMFNFFLEYMKKQDEALGAAIRPHMERYMETRRTISLNDFLLEDFNNDGMLPYPIYESDERIWDKTDTEALNKEIQKTGDYDQALENWQNDAA